MQKRVKEAGIIIKLNSLSDALLIDKLQTALRPVWRLNWSYGAFILSLFRYQKSKAPGTAISMWMNTLSMPVSDLSNLGKEKIFIPARLDGQEPRSPCWSCDPGHGPVHSAGIKEIIHIQLRDNR